jgi:hypothetical protein
MGNRLLIRNDWGWTRFIGDDRMLTAVGIRRNGGPSSPPCWGRFIRRTDLRRPG